MQSTGYNAEPSLQSSHAARKPLPEEFSERVSSPFLPTHPPVTMYHGKSIANPLMLWPLALHFLGALATTATLIWGLDGRHLHLDRQPQVKLADGTIEFNHFGNFNILQADAITTLSVSLMVLRWIAAAWAGPLCWRVIFLLAEKHGLRRHDIKWVASYGLLPPATNFRHPLNLVSGLILILTLAHHTASPLLIGSISWIPSSSTIVPGSHPVINITGFLPGQYEGYNGIAIDGTRISTFDTDVVINFYTAWDQNVEQRAFKRVVPSASKLAVNSTVESVLVPFFATTKIEWLPDGEEQLQKLPDLQKGNDIISYLFSQLKRPAGVAVVVDYNESLVDLVGSPYSSSWTLTVPLLVNVARDVLPERCDSSTTIIPENSTIPYFYVRSMPVFPLYSSACLAYANLTYNAGSGICRACRITSHSTVQNDTELEIAEDVPHDQEALNSLPRHVHTLARLTNSLPEPVNNLDAYISALFARTYSALWETWAGTRRGSSSTTSSYRPSFPTLKAEVDRMRVAVWLALQLLITLSGLLFIWLQSSSLHPLVTDTSMVAFDIDSTEVPKPDGLNKDKAQDTLRVEPNEGGWKVVVASGGRKHEFE